MSEHLDWRDDPIARRGVEMAEHLMKLKLKKGTILRGGKDVIEIHEPGKPVRLIPRPL